MLENVKSRIREHLNLVYKDEKIVESIICRIEETQEDLGICKNNIGKVSQKDVMLITYGDSLVQSGKKSLNVLNEFMDKYVGDTISSIHLLPMFPYTSDDGFSVVDYRKINPDLGDWEDIKKLNQSYKLMFDAVINHISKESHWFKGFLNGEEKYKDYFICADENADYSSVTRPRTLPLLTEFETKNGKKFLWTTFSDDQIDLNYKNSNVLIEIINTLIFYARNGAKYIRLDAIGFMWKELNTTCMHLPEVHEIIKATKEFLEYYVPETMVVTETNVPHKDNIAYLGNGHDEANMVYQFPLPPLTMFSFITEDATKLSEWASSIKPVSEDATYFNFLASHDGIGIRPTEGILTAEEQNLLVENTMRNGGRVSYKTNEDGSKSPYELNINYQDGLSSPWDSNEIRMKRFLASQCVLMSVVGVPGIYIHSLLGSRNDYLGVESSGINRRINREKMDYNKIVHEISEGGKRHEIFTQMLNLIQLRKKETAFAPEADQQIIFLDSRIFSLVRENKKDGEKILVVINVSKDTVNIETPMEGIDIISGKKIGKNLSVEGLDYLWIKVN